MFVVAVDVAALLSMTVAPDPALVVVAALAVLVLLLNDKDDQSPQCYHEAAVVVWKHNSFVSTASASTRRGLLS